MLKDHEITKELQKLHMAWAAIGNDYLVRSFKTATFTEGVDLVNRIAKIAEAQQHHPDITLTYSTVEVRISTHSVAGITDADFTLASAIDAHIR